MPEKIPVFRTEAGEAEFYRAYDAVLQNWPVPYEERYITTQYGETHIICSGSIDAYPVILIHPAGGGAAIWLRNVDPLSKAYRVYAIDTISEANKSILTHPISFRNQRHDFTIWMKEIFDGLQIERANLVGNSFGGFVALNTAYSLPEKVNKVVLISPAATFVPIPAWARHFIPANMMGPLIGSKKMLLDAYEWIWQDFPMEDCMAQLRSVSALYGRPRHWNPGVFKDEELQQINLPILLLIGDHEVIYKPEDAIRKATRFLPDCKVEIIPNANHIAEYTAADAVNSAILDFFAS